VFNKVMIGIDEHQGGRDAIALARQLVSDDGELTLAYVHGGYPIPARGSNSAFEATERDRALTLLSNMADETGIKSVRCKGSPSVGRGLHELAELDATDLLVIGSTRHGLLGRVLIGDDTRHALEGSPCAVAIAPAGYAQQTNVLTEIGVAYNESAESKHALRVARALAAGWEAKLSAFEAVSLPSYMFLGPVVPIVDSTQDLVDDARKRIADLGDIEAHAAYGDPTEELTVYSASLDLLVVGSRDYGPVGRLLHGSTTERLAHTARCPLLVLTRAARVTETDAPSDDHSLVATSQNGEAMSILICYDGSPSAKEAISVARATLSPTNITTLLHVWSPPVAFLADSFSDPGITADPPKAELDRLARERAQAIADEGLELADALGIDVDIRLERNDSTVAETILAVVRKTDPDLIVIGTHGHTAVQPELLGSVSAAVVHHSKTPVLIVPGPAKDDARVTNVHDRELSPRSIA
jgi:nucleotide-binding universal stress UspA family protein